MSALRSLVALGLLAAAASVQAQALLQPGLWEVTTQIQGERGSQMAEAMEKMQKQLASLPPDQRKMVEDMMAKQGVKSASGGGTTIKVCMTQAMVERNDYSGQRGNCTNTVSPKLGNTIKFHYSCTNPTSSGEGEMTFLGREGYTQKININHSAAGKPEKMELNSKGKWLGADCGSIKPIVAPAK